MEVVLKYLEHLQKMSMGDLMILQSVLDGYIAGVRTALHDREQKRIYGNEIKEEGGNNGGED